MPPRYRYIGKNGVWDICVNVGGAREQTALKINAGDVLGKTEVCDIWGR